MDIELRSISKRFGTVQANDSISLTVHSGRIIGVLGENGAGKSTLMKILAGYQPADSGDIVLDGKRAHYVTPQDAIAAGVGMLQQDPLDIAPFTVIENFIYGRPGGFFVGRRAAAKQLSELSRRFGFELEPEMPVASLTIGQRQQLEIVRLLALGVKTLILDEPTTGISAEQKHLLFEALRELAQHDKMSVLLVSHKLEDVIALCDEVIVLRAGKVVGAAQMPTTTDQLVGLMFGQVLTPHQRPPVAIGEAVAQMDQVTLRGRRVTVEHFSMRVQAGEVIGLAGLDGSGQELVLRACAGLVKPSRGSIHVGGKVMTGKSYREYLRAGVAFSAAGRLEEGLISGMTLTEHIALASTQGALIQWGAARDLTAAQISQYNVRGKPSDEIQQLSGGNQQRVLMALMPQKPLLMALEQPTRGLDVDSARWIWTQLLARRENGTAIIFTSPDLDELVAYSDRIFVAFAGQVREIQVTQAAHEHPDALIDRLGRAIGGDFGDAAIIAGEAR